jgi:hypothetical protein
MNFTKGQNISLPLHHQIRIVICELRMISTGFCVQVEDKILDENPRTHRRRTALLNWWVFKFYKMIDKRPIEDFNFTQEEYDRYQAGEEVWRDIDGYEGLYRVSTNGNVMSVGRVKFGYSFKVSSDLILKGTVNSEGYKIVQLCKSGKRTTKTLHKLIGSHFLSNKLKKPLINHLDGVKVNLYLFNLEYASYKENAVHSVTNGLQPKQKGVKGVKIGLIIKPINQLSMHGEIIRRYESVKEACKDFDVDISCIYKCANGRCNSAGGSKWKYCE